MVDSHTSARLPAASGTPMAREYDILIERDREGWLVASVPALPGCQTQARSKDELLERIREAILACLEEQAEEPEALEFVGMQRVRVA